MAQSQTPDWEKLVRRLERLLRLRSFPVALKMLPRKEDLAAVPFLRRPQHKMTLCQLISLARNFDWTVGADADDFVFGTCPSILGLSPVPPHQLDGTFRSIVWVQTKQDGRRYEEAIARLPLYKYQAVTLAPLVYKPFEPDLVLIYANPAQMILLINALQFEAYEVMHFSCVGESSCSDAIARCFLEGEPRLSIPCYGERRYGHAQDDELVMALPAGSMVKALKGLEALYRRGVRYPISFAGAESDISGSFPVSYQSLESMLAKVRGNPQALVLGLTGVVAGGKSTVAQMLQDKGAKLIDFDRLARQVVEPGQPAFQEIIGYFGAQVRAPDGSLDRKRLSAIVFQDMEKRKKLEGFTHPRIYEAFFEQLDRIVGSQEEAIILVDVPLLIEQNLSYLFDQVLVVAASPEVQVERLMARDGISRQEAANIIGSQLPAAEKVGFADFVIDNNGSRAQSQKQVDELWPRIVALAREKSNQP